MLQHAADHLQSGRVTELAVSPDVQIARLDMKIAVVLVEELLPIRAIGSLSDVLQRRHNVVSDDISRVQLHHAINILGADRLSPMINSATTSLRRRRIPSKRPF